MKAVPKVDTDGLFIEDVVVDDSFFGVVPFYAAATEADGKEDTPEPKIAGYTVGVPVPAGLHKPRFDLAAWNAYQEAVSAAKNEYQAAYVESSTLLRKERGEAPNFVQPGEPVFWNEGLAPEEIAELKAPSQHELSETEQLKKRIADLEVALAQLMAGK